MNKSTCAALSTVLGGVLLIGGATDSHAATPIRLKALDTAAAQKNDPYESGAEGPSKFDCSGLTYYSFRKHGKTLPRTAQGQYNKAKKISWGNRAKGDLVFIGNSSGSIYHVGIYAGNGKMWNANTGPYRGKKVVLAPISEYTSGAPKAYIGRFTG